MQYAVPASQNKRASLLHLYHKKSNVHTSPVRTAARHAQPRHAQPRHGTPRRGRSRTSQKDFPSGGIRTVNPPAFTDARIGSTLAGFQGSGAGRPLKGNFRGDRFRHNLQPGDVLAGRSCNIQFPKSAHFQADNNCLIQILIKSRSFVDFWTAPFTEKLKLCSLVLVWQTNASKRERERDRDSPARQTPQSSGLPTPPFAGAQRRNTACLRSAPRAPLTDTALRACKRVVGACMRGHACGPSCRYTITRQTPRGLTQPTLPPRAALSHP